MREDNNGKVVAFEPKPSSSKPGDVRPAEKTAPVLQFTSKPNESSPSGSSSRAADNSAEVFGSYLGFLLDRQIISWQEGAKLRKAVAPLLKLIPNLSEETKEEVRAEFDEDPKPTKYGIASRESGVWEDAARMSRILIPGFDLERAHRHFKVADPKYFSRAVRPMRPQWRSRVTPPKEPYVPPHLHQGEVFFFIVLRMFRMQLRKNK